VIGVSAENSRKSEFFDTTDFCRRGTEVNLRYKNIASYLSGPQKNIQSFKSASKTEIGGLKTTTVVGLKKFWDP
jgi:hypothetical protein